MLKLSLVLVALTTLLAGCAISRESVTSGDGVPFPAAQPRVEQQVQIGAVYSVRDVTLESSSGVGTVAGAVIGGAAGSKIGKGRGAKLMTILGVLGGAVAGDAVERGISRVPGVEITVRMANGALVAITQEKELSFPVRSGNLVRIISSGRYARVAPL